MAIVKIPTSTNPRLPVYTQITALDGSEYQLRFEFNQRNGFWYLSILNQDGDYIAAGLQLVTGWPLNLGLVDDRLPPGDVQVYDLRNQDGRAGLSDLGSRFELLYITTDA